MSTKKEDTPNWGGNTLGTNGVGNLSEQSKDPELRTMKQDLTVGQASPEAEYSPGGPKVKSTIVSEPRSSVD